MALADSLLELQELTKRLRRDCPWDREQTARTIVPHTVEEAYEVADAAMLGKRAGELLADQAALARMAQAALAAYRPHGLTLVRRIPLGEWVTLVLRA